MEAGVLGLGAGRVTFMLVLTIVLSCVTARAQGASVGGMGEGRGDVWCSMTVESTTLSFVKPDIVDGFLHCSARRRSSLAFCQSRRTVRSVTPSVSAISGSVRPPK